MTSNSDLSEFQLYLQAGSEATSPSELSCLVSSCYTRVRLRVAENPRTPISSIQVLANDESADVRLAVAANSTTPIELMRRLAKDHDPTVRYGIAEDANVAQEILDQLTNDENPYVCARAAKTIRSITLTDQVLQCHPRFLPELQPRQQDSKEESVS
jgi:hypothetical protein